MTLSEYRKTRSWKGAMDVAPSLIRLAEELPASEEMGLSFQLRQLIVEVPASVASDLLRGTELRHKSVLRLVTAIDLIDRVYPALDTTETRQAVEQLAEHLTGAGFRDELESPHSQAPAPAAPAPAPHHEPGPAPDPAEVQLTPDTTRIATEPALPHEPEHAEPQPPTRVAVQPDTAQETDVQPNSV
ncbi:MAG: hypothetical protein K0S68_449 [Candidatus Saccharibacteria bacterium]|jgi:hypothetical protein|nr:hypothetical protein [Candidatus Saccharibacteria bacterium]